MATPLSGRYASVRTYASGSSGEPNSPGILVGNLGHWEVAISFDELDASVFGTVWKANMVGMQHWSGTIEGFFDAATSSGQQIGAILGRGLDATKLQDIRFYLQTSSGMFFMPTYPTYTASTDLSAGAYVSNIRIAHDKNGLASASYSIVGYGGLALFSGSSDANFPAPIIVQGPA